jgi:4'-phosphopantetheinyl transferase
VRNVISPNTAHVWSLPTIVPADRFELLKRTLTDEERTRAASFVSPERARHFATIRGVVRVVLASYLNLRPGEVRLTRSCTYCGKEHGKPRISGEGGVEFNLSHSDGAALLAISAAPIGVDIEGRSALSRMERLADVILSGDEKDRVPADAEHLLRQWVRKEAFLKLTGLGIAIAPRRFSIIGDEPLRVRVENVPALAEYGGSEIMDIVSRPGYFAALSSRQPIERVTHLTFDEKEIR